MGSKGKGTKKRRTDEIRGKLSELSNEQIIQKIRLLNSDKSVCILKMGFLVKEFLDRSNGNVKDAVKRHLPFGYSTARNYIKVSTIFKKEEKVKPFDSRSLYLMVKEDFPLELRKDLIQRGMDGEKLSLDAIQKEWGKYNERNKSKPPVEAEVKSKESASSVNEAVAGWEIVANLKSAAKRFADEMYAVVELQKLTVRQKDNVKKIRKMVKTVLQKTNEKVQ